MYEDKNNNEYESGSWWADYQTQKPQEAPEEIYYEKSYTDYRKKFLIIGIIVAIVLLLLVGGGIAYALLSQQPQEQQQSTEQTEEATTNAPSEVTVYITADGTNENSGAAKVVISSLNGDNNASENDGSGEGSGSSSDTGENGEDTSAEGQASEVMNTVSFQQVATSASDSGTEEAGNEGNADQTSENGDVASIEGDKAGEIDTSNIEGTIIQERDITTNQTISIGELDPGDYRLTVVSVPVNEDGSTYQLPMSATDFTVGGDGKMVNVFVYLPKVVDGEVQEPSEEELAAAQEEATGSLETQDQTTSTNESDNTGGSSESAHTHTWEAVTTTVHHEAVYRTVHHEAVKERITVCTTCGQDITNNYTAHKNSTGHSGYRYDTKVIRDAYDEQVLVSGAYDETVVTGYKCSGCGATR